jgi:hypothetical protein
MVSWFVISHGLCTPTFMFNLFYSAIYGPLMGVLFKTIGLFITTVGTTAVCIESCLFNKFKYITPVYNIIKRIESILPSIKSCPRPMYSTTSPNGLGRNNNNKSSSGRHLHKYFSRKRLRSKSTVIYASYSQSISSSTKFYSKYTYYSKYTQNPSMFYSSCFLQSYFIYSCQSSDYYWRHCL